MSVDDAASATEDQSSVTLPVDLTLVPGTYPVAAALNRSCEGDGQPGFFDAVSPAGGPGPGAAQSGPPPTDLACRLYSHSPGRSLSSYTLMGLETAGWALPAPSSGH